MAFILFHIVTSLHLVNLVLIIDDADKQNNVEVVEDTFSSSVVN